MGSFKNLQNNALKNKTSLHIQRNRSKKIKVKYRGQLRKIIKTYKDKEKKKKKHKIMWFKKIKKNWRNQKHSSQVKKKNNNKTI